MSTLTSDTTLIEARPTRPDTMDSTDPLAEAFHALDMAGGAASLAASTLAQLRQRLRKSCFGSAAYAATAGTVARAGAATFSIGRDSGRKTKQQGIWNAFSTSALSQIEAKLLLAGI